MKKPIAFLVAALLLGVLGAVAPSLASAEASCPDPAQSIADDLGLDPYVAVGIKHTQTLTVEVYTRAGCGVTSAKATIRAPRATRTVMLHKVGTVNDLFDRWRGSLAISPASLRNSDAGVWPVTYAVSGEATDTRTVHARIVRASRLSFNAGPEPVRNNRLTYAGKLTRASWDSRRYIGYRKPVNIYADYDAPSDGSDLLARPTTRADGTFRLTQAFAGGGSYYAVFVGSSTTAPGYSRRDRVDAP